MRPFQAINRVLQDQRGALMPWCPVFMGLGVAGFFQMRAEPNFLAYAGMLALLLAGTGLIFWRRESLGSIGLAIAFLAAGGLLAGIRTHAVAGAVLDYRYYGPIEGEVVALDRSASNAVRVTLVDVVLEDMHPDETPRSVRVSLFGDQDFVLLRDLKRSRLLQIVLPPLVGCQCCTAFCALCHVLVGPEVHDLMLRADLG